MATAPQDENTPKQTSPQAKLPEASCTAAQFYSKHLDQNEKIDIGPFTYAIKKNHDALPWEFPTKDWLEALRADSENTAFYQHLLSPRAEEKQRARYLPDQERTMTADVDPAARAQFAAKLAKMRQLWGVAACARKELNEKVVAWMEVESSLRWNVGELYKLLRDLDLLLDEGMKGRAK